MASHTFWQYLHAKFWVSFLRLFLYVKRRLGNQYDQLLCAQTQSHRQMVRIPSRDKGRMIEAWLYFPPGAPANRRSPILLNWHGSGFIIPDLGRDHVFCSKIAGTTGLVVLDVDYRKSPETPFPGPIHDVEDTLQWVANQPDRFDLDRVAVSGFSAGATLALVAASSLRVQFPSLRIRAVVAFYPLTDLTIEPALKTVPKPLRPCPTWVARLFNESYVPEVELRLDPRISPGLADLALFPSTVMILTCEGDIFSPEGDVLAERLMSLERKVYGRNLENARHGFDKDAEPGSLAWEQREFAYTMSINVLREALDL
ncbi:hypothetical protein ACJ41O_006243 [Fusarium nematophilum]